MTLNQQHYLVSGAAGGIGFAVAETLLTQGARLSLFDINADLLASRVDALQNRFGQHQVDGQVVDISDTDAVKQAVQQALTDQGPLSGLAHTAATLSAAPLTDMAVADFQSMLTTNVLGSFNILQHCARPLRQQGHGAIVVIGSNSATAPRLNIGAYGASKAAVHMLVKNFALELAEFGVRCNLVSPGSTRTEMLEKTWRDGYGEAETIAGEPSSYRLGIPLGKIAEPTDIANAVAFLLNDAAGHITMHDLRVDGGATLNQMG